MTRKKMDKLFYFCWCLSFHHLSSSPTHNSVQYIWITLYTMSSSDRYIALDIYVNPPPPIFASFSDIIRCLLLYIFYFIIMSKEKKKKFFKNDFHVFNSQHDSLMLLASLAAKCYLLYFVKCCMTIAQHLMRCLYIALYIVQGERSSMHRITRASALTRFALMNNPKWSPYYTCAAH